MPDRIDPPRFFDNGNELARPAAFVKSPGTSHLLDNPKTAPLELVLCL